MDDQPPVRTGTAVRERARSAPNTHVSGGRPDATSSAALTAPGPRPPGQGLVPALVPFAAVAPRVGLENTWATAWLVFLLVPAAGVLFQRSRAAEPGED